MKTRMLVSVFCALLSLAPAFAGDALLIKDMETLRDSLPFRDPGRPLLTRRLADLHFQKAVEDDKNLLLTGKGNAAEIKHHRDRAARLYKESLDGEGGTYTPVEGELKVKIQFQMARIDRMNGEKARALNIFQTITASNAAGPDLKREAYMTVAEMRDEDGAWKEAMAAYQAALPLCRGQEAVGYVRYRISWAYFRMGAVKEAQQEITHALWDAQGKPKDQVFADYIQFLAATPNSDGRDELTKIEPLAGKLNQPELIENLGEAFFAVGNRKAGTTVLAHAHRMRPDAFFAARLAEEYYGFRDWDNFRNELNSLDRLSNQVPKLTDKRREAVDQILRRLVVQIDGERKSNAGKFSEESCMAIDLHLKIFPKSDVANKMQSGWLAAQTDDAKKMARLQVWIQESVKAGDKEAEKRWRQDRASIAQKMKDHSNIQTEAMALSKLFSEVASQREWNYIAAKATQDMGQEDKALVMYKELAAYPVTNKVAADKWAIQSQNLALDILNKGKRFDELAAQAATWTDNAVVSGDANTKAEVASMARARDEARFEAAAALGETPAALKAFANFCVQGQFTEKACPNAKVLAVKLADQATLVQILEVTKDETAMTVEYERMGRFSDAAVLKEKSLKNTTDDMTWLQVATLYQVGGNQEGRMRVLRNYAQNLKRQKKMPADLEPAIMTTFLDAGMTATELMPLPWSTASRLNLAANFENKGQGDAATKKIIASSKEDMGPAWAEQIIARVEIMDQKQRAINFYGKNSTRQFQARLKQIGAFATETKNILPGASTPVRAYLLEKLANSYADLDKEILATPMPEGLDAEQTAQVQAALESLAAPMRTEAEAYRKLQTEQLATLNDKAQAWQETITQGSEAVMTKIRQESEAQNATITSTGGKQMSVEQRKQVLEVLARDPANRSALEQLRDDHTARGEKIPAAYFTGRLSDTEKKI